MANQGLLARHRHTLLKRFAPNAPNSSLAAQVVDEALIDLLNAEEQQAWMVEQLDTELSRAEDVNFSAVTAVSDFSSQWAVEQRARGAQLQKVHEQQVESAT